MSLFVRHRRHFVLLFKSQKNHVFLPILKTQVTNVDLRFRLLTQWASFIQSVTQLMEDSIGCPNENY